MPTVKIRSLIVTVTKECNLANNPYRPARRTIPTGLIVAGMVLRTKLELFRFMKRGRLIVGGRSVERLS